MTRTRGASLEHASWVDLLFAVFVADIEIGISTTLVMPTE